MANVEKPQPFMLIGGRACLDLVNSLGGIRGVKSTEGFPDHASMMRWAVQAKVVSRAEAARLGDEAQRHPKRAEQALQRTRTLREALHGLFEAVAHQHDPPAVDLALVNAALAEAQSARQLVRTRDSFDLPFVHRADDLAPFLGPLVVDAAALLSSPDAGRIRVCAEESERRCDWVFLDESRAGTRRFCSMSDCGNRAKQRRHYRKLQEERSH